MKPLRFLLLATALALPGLALAQWQWLDKDGRKVFSDRPPPPDITQNRILKQPGGAAAAAVADGAAGGASAPMVAKAAPAASAPKVSGRDKELEDKKKQAEAAEAEKKKAEETKLAAARSENCTRAKQEKATFDSGVRIAKMNSKGEREILDDNQRAVEVKRLNSIIASDCK